MCATGAKQCGFTLAEVAVVVLIVGLLLGGLLGTYSTQIDLSRTAETKKTLETARDALIGFAAANGRLPCPATATSNGVEVGTAGVVGVGGVCQVGTAAGGGQPGLGFVPAATLALTPTDSQGYLIDSWGSRIRYAVTNSGSSEFTTQGQIRTKLTDLDPNTPSPDLRICTTSTGASSTTCSGTSTTLTTSAVAVIFSTGKNGATGGTGTDESKNLDNDRVFISHEPTPAGAANGEFDDILIWLSPSILYNRILSG
ncbi:MAG TPA: prepilin-type N-terminal cleavage/methylation domain-containing protein, partial [Bradyrhizobium sp.]|nr:prepilin-type N-terminal cleavage/methylation domain-containing protein [Bradyrhizobium sp.]